MKIVLVNKWDVTGGAARAAFRLYSGLRQTGHEVSYLVNVKKNQEDNNIVGLLDISPDERFLEHLVQKNYINGNRTSLSNTAFTCSLAGIDLTTQESISNADVINLHWIEKFIAPQSLAGLVMTGKPLVWTLHDERPFTGGCHYSAGCSHFSNNCLPCPQLEDDPFEFPKFILHEIEEIINNASLAIVTPSKWLADQARKSRLFRNKRVEVIPNSLDTDIFFPVASKNEAKQALDVEPETVTLLFGAENHKEKRKGFAPLMEAMHICLRNDQFAQLSRDAKLLIMTVGSSDEGVQNLDIPVRHFGYVKDDAKMVSIYNAADMFILPSLEDNLPNTMLESMACSTPVIGFRTGGIPDFVRDGESGLLADTGDANDLARAISRMVFDKGFREKCGRNSRQMIEQTCSLDHQAKAYSRLFSEQIENNTGKTDNDSLQVQNKLARYDSLFGAALRFCLEKANKNPVHQIACPVCASDPARFQRCKNYIQLKSSVTKLCQIGTIRKPLQKYEAYQNMLLAYRKIK